MNDNILLY